MPSKQSAAQLYLPGFDMLSLFAEPSSTNAFTVKATVVAEPAPVAQVISLDDLGVVEVFPTQAVSAEQEQSTSAVAAIEEDDAVHFGVGARQAPRVEAIRREIAKVLREAAPWVELAASLHDDLGGKVTKFNANIEALQLLKRLESEQVVATDEERIVLSRYTGWGGLKEAFDGYMEWRDRKDMLLNLVGEKDFAEARGTVLNAHYTPLSIVKAMWQALQAMGFKGGRVLDPSCGTGYFFGGMPADLAQRSEMTAIEIDGLTARIAKAIYGHAASIKHTGFEKFASPDGWYDLALTNVPFGTYSVACGLRRAYSTWTIHNYFLGRMVDAVRPGGLIALITSSHFMDSQEELKRSWVHQRAELVGAVRLPQGAFSRVANTDVVADMLFFRRREPGALIEPSEPAWIQRAAIPQSQIDELVAASMRERNEYWASHPDAVVGKWKLTGGQHGQVLVPVCEKVEAEVALAKAIDTLPKDVYRERADFTPKVQAQPVACIEANGEKPGSFVVRDGEIFIVEDGQYREVQIARTRAARIARLVEVRDATRALLVRQLEDDATDDELAGMRSKLSDRYDALVKQHGWIHSKGNAMAFRQDPDWPLLLSLENYDDEKDLATKAAIFTVRTGRPSMAPTKASSPEDAVAISIAETGHLNPTYLAQLLTMNVSDVMAHLATLGLAFLNPETGLYEGRDEYLCGNVRNKLRIAELAGEDFSRNVRALGDVMPADLPPGDIDVRPGSPWVPAEDYVDFVKSLDPDMFKPSYASLAVTRDRLTGVWAIKTSAYATTINREWGTKDVAALHILQEAMNGRQITVYDSVFDARGKEKRVVNVENTAAAREAQGKLEDRFKEWLWSDAERSMRLHRLYNDEFNSIVERCFDGSRLRLPGFSRVVAPAEHQLNGVARLSTGFNTLLAHCVGAGKTLTMVMGSMELKRLGIANKPMHVVPGHCLVQYTAEFLRAYPNANVLMVTKEDLSKERRKAFCARVATGDWDSVVLTHSAFELISPSPEVCEGILQEQLDEVQLALQDLKGDREARPQIKQLVRMEKEWKARLERANASWKKDDFITLKDMGVDLLLIDEAHLHKALFRFSQMERVSGLPTSNSQRAFDMYVKTREIMRLHGDRQRGVVFATATPIANSMAEFHVMQRYLQPKTLEAAGLMPFDSWAAMFGRTVTTLEVSPDGSSFRMASRFAQFLGLPELMTMFRQVADVKTAEMLNLPTPPVKGGGAQVIAAKASEQLKALIGSLVERAEAIRNRGVSPDKDNMLAVTNDGRRAALDMRMIDPSAGFDPCGKVALCIAKAFELWQESAEFLGTQLIFCDMGTPSGRSFNLYEDIRQRLIAKGVPRNEIAFIHEAATDAAKASLFKKVREGLVRFLLGSTSKMGIGTNVQTRLLAVHHLDVPWRPCDLQQRDGRIERRGNLCDAVYIFRYVTEGSFDAYSWQTVSAKCRFIDQVMTGDATQRRVEDISATALSYEEVKAIACGNPVVREKALLDAECRKLGLLASHHRKTVSNATWELQRVDGYENLARGRISAIESDDLLIQANAPLLEIDGATYSRGGALFEVLGQKMKQLRKQELGAFQRVEVFRFAGLPVTAAGETTRIGDYVSLFGLYLGGRWVQAVKPYVSGERVFECLEEALEARKVDLEEAHNWLQSVRRQRSLLEAQATAVFEHGERLQQVRRRVEELELELGLAKEDAGLVAVDASETVVNNTSVAVEEAEAGDVDGSGTECVETV
jgi:N12 class adenine-specific DNA methylase